MGDASLPKRFMMMTTQEITARVSPERRVPLSRRQFLARCGALGAAAMAAQLPGMSIARAASRNPLLADVGPALRLLARDTVSGLVAFVVPGPDRFSQAQGMTHPRPGGVDAHATDPMLEALDAFLPLPDSFVQAMAAGLATGMSDVPMPALDPVLGANEEVAATLDSAFQAFVANDEAVPLSLLVALMLNYAATSVSPAAISGPILSAPFANLTYAEKVEVFRRLEEENGELVALLDGDAPEPFRASLSGTIQLLGGTLTVFAALYSYCEAGVFDSERSTVASRPVGWELSRYMPGRTRPADGWNEFKGYYHGRRKAEPSGRRGREKRGRGSDA